MTTKLLRESNTKPLVRDDDGTYPVVLITPGQGSSGYYSEALLKEYAATTWPEGTHSYINHLQEGEVRSPEKMMGVLTETAHWDEAQQAVVSRVKPFKHWAPFVEEVYKYTGMSISAGGEGSVQEIDGNQTFVVESLTASIDNTVDMVSYAGRGGKIVERLYESAIGTQTPASQDAGDQRKVAENMALEEKVDHLTSVVETLSAKFDSVLTENETLRSERESKGADAEKAIEATLAVESAEVPVKVKESLRESIKAGNYDVAPRLAEAVAVRESVLEEQKNLLESAGSFDSGRTSGASDNTVNGW